MAEGQSLEHTLIPATDSTHCPDADSHFRTWFKCLHKLQDRRLEWPQLLRFMISEELSRMQNTGISYTGEEVFIDRDKLAQKRKTHLKQEDEVIQCYRLYCDAHEKTSGALNIAGEPIWIISCQVPNQGNHRKRCADLLGLRRDGSLVVFEAKVEGGTSPLYAVIEGLDYLGHLLIADNMARLTNGFEQWRTRHGSPDVYSQTPPGFEDVHICPKAKHSVLVLAPLEYYEFHRTDAKGINQGWEYVSDRYWPKSKLAVRLDFAVTNYSSASCVLLPLDVVKPGILPGTRNSGHSYRKRRAPE